MADANTGQQIYGAGNDASINGAGTTQMREFYWQKKALIEIVKEQYFQQMADVTAMPKHYGKTIKKYHYMPLLDDRNINDQGIDASGAILDETQWSAFNAAGVSQGTTFASEAAALAAAGAGGTAVKNGGNLYGSSKDIGAISAKLPALSETGGRVNRVGFKRLELQGSIEKFGFFDEYTKESIDFDSDDELLMHVNREMMRGANELTEDALQIDLLNAAGITVYGGEAVSDATVHGDSAGANGVEVSEITYEDLMRLSIQLDNNRCPKNTRLISGSRLIDTKTINGARYIYIGSELIPMVRKMTDLFGNQAFVSVEKYASAGNVARGEIGSIDQFRVIVVPEMHHWAGAGAEVGVVNGAGAANSGYRTSNVNGGAEAYDVFPMLVVGSGSFTTIGFQTDGKTVKFKVKHIRPESEQAYTRDDPFGETGFMSIKWYYGSLILRPEWIAVLKCVAEL